MIKFCYKDVYLHLKLCKGVNFSPREIDIASCLLNGHTSKKSIAELLGTEVRTIETHIRNMMRKVNCSSWERIRDFFEKSELLEIYQQHFKILLQTKDFQKILREIAPNIKKNYASLLIFYDEHHKISHLLIKQLKDFFKQIDINVFMKSKNDYTERSHANINSFVVCLSLPQENAIEITPNGLNESFNREIAKIILYEDQLQSSASHPKINDNFFVFCLNLLQAILPDYNFDNYYAVFSSYHSRTQRQLEGKKEDGQKTNFFIKIPKLKMLSLISMIAFIFIVVMNYQLRSYIQFPMISSELRLPDHSILLERKNYMHNINMLFKAKAENVPVVVLLGDGGSGKTTLARLFARSYNTPVVWEINAETPHTLFESFKELAANIAKQTSQEKNIERLETITDINQRREAMVNYVKAELKRHKSWLIIFDNVNSFSSIYPYLPNNDKTWGDGKVIITTRNQNINESEFIKKSNIIHVGLLSTKESLELFNGVLKNSNPTLFSTYYAESTSKIVNNLPKLPLDIVVAAKYISAESMLFQDYFNKLNSQDKDMSSVYKKEENLQAETSDYRETRYKIVTLSIERIIKENPNFTRLFHLISNVNSQNIPLDLLEHIAPKNVIKEFILNLQKYYLVELNISRENPKTLSVQRSVHKIFYNYFFNQNSNASRIKPIQDDLVSYINTLADQENFSGMKAFLPHLETIINNGRFIARDPIFKASLGYFLYYTGINHETAKKILEGYTGAFQSTSQFSDEDLIRILLYLGAIYRINGKIALAKSTLEKALNIFFTLRNVSSLLMLQINQNLGKVYLALGEHKKTINLASQNLNEYKVHHPKNINGICRTLLILGRSNKELGRYADAIVHFNEAFNLLRQHKQEEHIAFALACLGLSNCYEALGDYTEALKYANLSDTFYQNHYSPNHINIAWSLSHKVRLYYKLGLQHEFNKYSMVMNKNYKLGHKETNVHGIDWIIAYTGITFTEIGQYKLAKPYLEQAISMYSGMKVPSNLNYLLCKYSLAKVWKEEKEYPKSKDLFAECLNLFERHFGKGHLHTAQLLRDFSDLYLLEGNLSEAEKLLFDSLHILDEIKHTDRVFNLQKLSILYLKKAELIRPTDVQQATKFVEQSLGFIEQAYEIGQSRFPKDSLYLSQLKSERLNLRSQLQKLFK